MDELVDGGRNFAAKFTIGAAVAESTDRLAYAQAVGGWQKLKSALEDQDSKPHESEYLDVLREWRAVKDWSSQNSDQNNLDLARRKIKELETRFASKCPTPIATNDRFEARFRLALLENVDELIGRKGDLERIDWSRVPGLLNDQGQIKLDRAELESSDGSPLRITREIWRDRIKSQLHQDAIADAPASIEGNVARFLSQKRAQVDGGELSPGRYSMLDLHLKTFRDFVGTSSLVSAITSRMLTDFRTDLLERKTQGEFGGAYARDRLDSVKQFTRWLWRENTLAELPRIIESKNFTITPAAPEIKTLSIDEVKTLLGAASGAIKLFILLGLNTGFTQKDISDLQNSEVDWQAGIIHRKRSKTKKFENVPEVTYTLWPETLRLLVEHRSLNGPNVLANENGGALLTVKLNENGRLYKVDNVHSRFFRLCKHVCINDRSFKSLRKTSATLLRGNEKYSGLESLFLGHAARSISDRHYAGIPHELLASAVNWLAVQFGLAATCKRSGSPRKERTKPVSQPAPKRVSSRVAKAAATRAS